MIFCYSIDNQQIVFTNSLLKYVKAFTTVCNDTSPLL